MKSTRFVFDRALAVLCALLFVSFGFMSCQQEDDDNGLPDGVYELSSSNNLVGSWTSSYSEVFEISTSDFSCKDTYAGDNLVVSYSNDDKTVGYIYIKYTEVYDYAYTEPEDASAWSKVTSGNYTFWKKLSSTKKGKWYAVAFKELTASSVSLSGAYNASGKTSAETLEEAISTFTIANGYFDIYSECVKQ